MREFEVPQLAVVHRALLVVFAASTFAGPRNGNPNDSRSLRLLPMSLRRMPELRTQAPVIPTAPTRLALNWYNTWECTLVLRILVECTAYVIGANVAGYELR